MLGNLACYRGFPVLDFQLNVMRRGGDVVSKASDVFALMHIWMPLTCHFRPIRAERVIEHLPRGFRSDVRFAYCPFTPRVVETAC